jgi:hypothetical protein
MSLPARTFHAGPVNDRLLTRLRTLGLALQAGQDITEDGAELLILCLPACLEELADHRLRRAQALEMDPAQAPVLAPVAPLPGNVVSLGRHWDGR